MIYLDHNAGTPIAAGVRAAMLPYLVAGVGSARHKDSVAIVPGAA